MKKSQIKVGGIYVAKVSGKLTHVRVDSINEHPAASSGGWNRSVTRYGVTNLKTGRTTSFRSATKFRAEIKDGKTYPDGVPTPTEMLETLSGLTPEQRASVIKAFVDQAAWAERARRGLDIGDEDGGAK